MARSLSDTKKLKWTVIGGGNGGQSLAGHLALMGFQVKLYDIFETTIEAIRAQGGIHVQGAVNGFGKLALATTDMAAAVSDAHILMVVAPAIAHRDIAKTCAPHLSEGQLIFVHPGATGGALEFKQALRAARCRASVTLAESNSLLYACRCPAPGDAHIFGIKKELQVAALPASENDNVLRCLTAAFPQITSARNVLETSLGNPNAMMHPAPTLLNTSMIESDHEWRYYFDGITPSIGAFVEAIDRQRVAIGHAFGIDLIPILPWYRQAYHASGSTLTEAVRANPAYAEVKGQKTLRTRYLLEDIPTGLVPMAAFGQIAGVDVSRLTLVIQLGECLLDQDLTSTGRTLESMGIAGMSVEEILQFVEG